MNPPKQPRIPIEPFRWDTNDPLAAEHELVSRLVSENLKRGWQYYKELELEETDSGKRVIDSDPEAGARLVSALVAHAAYFDGMARKAKALAKSEHEKINWHHSPEFEHIWPSRQVSAQTVRRVLRRKLPLTPEILRQMAEWIVAAEWMSDVLYPLKAFIKATEACGPVDDSDSALRALLSKLASRLRTSHEKEHPKLAQQLDVLLSDGEPAPATPLKNTQEQQPRVERPDPSVPASAGSTNVLIQLKQHVKVLPADSVACTEVGHDHFPLRADSAFRDEHLLINTLLTELIGRAGTDTLAVFSKTNAGQAILARDGAGLGRVLLALTERCTNTEFVPMGGLGDYQCAQSQYNVYCAFRILLQQRFVLDRNGVFDLLLFMSAQPSSLWTYYAEFLDRLISPLDRFTAEAPFSAGERHVLHRLRCQMVRTCPFGRPLAELGRINKLIGSDLFLALVPGEAWSDAVNTHLAKCLGSVREKWMKLLQLAATATASRPSSKWLKSAKDAIADIGTQEFAAALHRWLPLVSVPRTVRILGGKWTGRPTNDIIHTDNATCLRGLLWMSPRVMTPDLIRVTGALTASCFRKVPGVGPRAPKVGNAGIYALSQINDPLAVGQLALLKVKVKSGSAQKEIEKAFNAAAERSGLPREELEELSVPTYGLTDVGICEEEMAGFKARLIVAGTTRTELEWVKPDGKVQRAVPAPVKATCKEDLKDLQSAAKDIEQMLPAQRERIDSLFLQQKTWPAATWRERYLNHPLVGTLARRILWDFKNGEKTITGIWFKEQLVDFDLKPIELSNENTAIQLWHPIGRATEEVKAWRDWLDEQQIQQPFKQAYREVYLLTDAERSTRVYSNRYAAHVIRQHQFNALCALRGWKNKLRLMVDDEYPAPSLNLPHWGLRAEFWVEGLGTDYGTDTNDSGVFLYLSTDQVRFYRTDSAQRMAHAAGGGYHPGYHAQDAEPLSLDEIPALVFSEVMRDVDLFVGVGSVGNDPAWSDGGPQGRYRDYWQNYSFGELNASAKTRREVLERLVTKLKIAGRCSFLDRFLVVKGALRTYKIHLGSGNILMEPNDQYLCIVPSQKDAGTEPLVLPFEGDRTLSVILSKAFLLAEDSKIKDSTILNQIKQ